MNSTNARACIHCNGLLLSFNLAIRYFLANLDATLHLDCKRYSRAFASDCAAQILCKSPRQLPFADLAFLSPDRSRLLDLSSLDLNQNSDHDYCALTCLKHRLVKLGIRKVSTCQAFVLLLKAWNSCCSRAKFAHYTMTCATASLGSGSSSI